MAVKVIFWQAPDSDLKKKAGNGPARCICAGVLLVLLAALGMATLLISDVFPRAQPHMHAIPKTDLIHTELVDADFIHHGAVLFTPPAAPPPAVPPRQEDPKPWVREALLPPRPLNSGAVPSANASGPWAYLVKDARPGTVLLGSRSADGVAILLLHVCAMQPSIFGVVLNEPTEDTMGGAFCPAAAERYPSFINSTVRHGGANGPHWTVLAHAASAGAQLVQPGLYAGGSLSELNRLAAEGRISAESVAFYSGYVAWHLDELQAQVDSGMWQIAKASTDLLLKPAEESDGVHYIKALKRALE